jgi:uncharacterized phage protein (TIGR02220 family)
MPDWFRLHTEFASDPVVQRLSFEDQRHYVVLLCAKKLGVLDKRLSSHALGAQLRALLRVDARGMKGIKRRLMRAALIGDDWQPRAWTRRQYLEKPADNLDNETQDNPSEIPVIPNPVTMTDLSWTGHGAFVYQNLTPKALIAQGFTKSGVPIGDVLGAFVDSSCTNSISAPLQVTENEGENLARSLLPDTESEQSKKINGEVVRTVIRGEDIIRVLKHLNDVSGSGFRWKNPKGQPTAHAKAVHALLKTGYTVEQCLLVINHKAAQWSEDDKMREYLRPSTLFRRAKFEQYLDQAE